MFGRCKLAEVGVRRYSSAHLRQLVALQDESQIVRFFFRPLQGLRILEVKKTRELVERAVQAADGDLASGLVGSAHQVVMVTGDVSFLSVRALLHPMTKADLMMVTKVGAQPSRIFS